MTLKTLIHLALAEDIGRGDVTTRVLVPRNQRGAGVIVAKEPGVLSGIKLAGEIFRQRDPSLVVKRHKKSGARVKKGEKILTVKGRVRSILGAERVALNFLGHLSGVATLTRRYVDKIRGTKARIYDTRKTTPLWRELEKEAVKSGGGKNHRFGLWDEILVKDNHWAAIDQSLQTSRSGARQSPNRRWLWALRALARIKKRKGVAVEIEVENLKQLAELLSLPFIPDRILLDNFSVRDLKRAVIFVEGLDYVLRTRYNLRRKTAGERRALPLLEASGRITLANIRAVALTGVDRISIGRLTHSAPALDFSLELRKA